MTETTTRALANTADLAAAPIGQISVLAHDIARAERFYRDVLGLRHLFSVPPRMAFFDAGGVRLMLSLPELPEHDHPGSILYFNVPDIHATHAELTARGVTFIDEPHMLVRMSDHELWMVFFRDSEDNIVGLMSEVRS